jgi:hypothetical protein
MTGHEKKPRALRDPATGRDMTPHAQPGYYPGHSTLAQKDHWDEATRKIVEKRADPDKPTHFFRGDEIATLQAVLNCVIPQDDRDDAHKIPVLAMLDEQMHARKFDGFIYDGTPEDDVTHREGLKAIQAIARARFETDFADLSLDDQETILLSIRDGKPGPAWTCAGNLPPKHYWSTLIKAAVSTYYAHPLAWDEIGFGGPAYPRGYMRLTEGRPEPWEKDEQRYDWMAPAGSRSDQVDDNTGLYAKKRKP